MILFNFYANEELIKDIFKSTLYSMSNVEYKNFNKDATDREFYSRSLVNVRHQNVYIVCNFHHPKYSIGELLFNLQLFIGSLVDSSANRITVVAPYLPYQRQDRKDKGRAPINTKTLAKQLEAVGANRVLTIDVHNLAAFSNAFRIPVDNLSISISAIRYLCGQDSYGGKIIDDSILSYSPNDFVVLSPDIGGMPRANIFREILAYRLGIPEVPIAVFDKRRDPETGKIIGKNIIGDVDGKRVIALDDMLDSGSTMGLAAKTAIDFGAEIHSVIVTHGLFNGNFEENLSSIDRIVVSNSIDFDYKIKNTSDGFKNKLNIISIGPMMGQAILALDSNDGSLSKLLDKNSLL